MTSQHTTSLCLSWTEIQPGITYLYKRTPLGPLLPYKPNQLWRARTVSWQSLYWQAVTTLNPPQLSPPQLDQTVFEPELIVHIWRLAITMTVMIQSAEHSGTVTKQGSWVSRRHVIQLLSSLMPKQLHVFGKIKQRHVSNIQFAFGRICPSVCLYDCSLFTVRALEYYYWSSLLLSCYDISCIQQMCLFVYAFMAEAFDLRPWFLRPLAIVLTPTIGAKNDY